MESRTILILILVSILFGYLVLNDVMLKIAGIYPKVTCVGEKE